METKLLLKILKQLVILLIVCAPFFAYSQVTINSENFNSNWGIWNDGGSDCERIDENRPNSTTSIRLRDDSGSSVMTTENINIPSFGTFSSVTITFDFMGYDMENNEDFFVEYSSDGGSNYTIIAEYDAGDEFVNGVAQTNVSVTINSPTYTFASNSRFRFRCDASGNDDLIYIDNVRITGISFLEINVQGNSVDIVNGDTTPSFIDYSNFGTTDLSTNITRTFTIQNSGTSNLSITGAVSITPISGTGSFAVTTAPSSPVGAATSTTFAITFTPSGIGSTIAELSIPNDDTIAYTFRIQADAKVAFFDSDGDGVFDDIDIDDDNDGIKDEEEESSCRKSPTASSTNYKFLNETFGVGIGRGSQLSTFYTAETTYCIEDGTVGTNTTDCPDLSSTSLNDGEYTIASLITTSVNGETVGPNDAIADWAWNRWANIEDHTPGDTHGRMAVFNADYNPGIFYETEIVGTLTGIPIEYSFYVINLDKKDSAFSSGELDAGGHRILPNVTVNFLRPDRSVITSFNTGDITRCSGETFVPADHTGPAGTHAVDATYNQCETSEWKYFSQSLTLTSETTFIVQFINNAVGGLGNDIAIDDIVISQTLCDTDNDGVADVFDLDSDNDGIPDIVEAGVGHLSGGTAKITGSVAANGMHVSAFSNLTLDSDGDGIPNYIDLDSDNDGIFDVDESGATNSSAYPGYQNGDGDISGNGVGQGPDSDAVREQNIDGSPTTTFYTDGILDIYDYFGNSGSNFAAAYGNVTQGETGTNWFHYVYDTDDDGIPDYIDVMSNGTTYDIAGTLYFSLDISPIDGIIDDASKTDTDGDGILDIFDTDDAAFGSPRDLNRKLHLYFDGRNDYVEDVPLISGATTLMAWIKVEKTGTQRILGQNNFYIEIDGTGKVSAKGPSTLTYDTALTLNQWVHVAATINVSVFKLYINGVEVKTTSGSILSADASPFTIGRQPNVNSYYYGGYIDEVRVFSKALTENELKKIVYQEIEKNGSNIIGVVIPKDIDDYVSSTAVSTALPWGNLQRYFRMDTYKDDIMDDLRTTTIDVGSGAKMYNMKVIKVQTAPLPFITQTGDTDLATALTSTEGVNGNDAITSPASIVKIEHKNITSNSSQQHVGLFVNEEDTSSNAIEYSIQNNKELNVSWYLLLNGAIDLEGESQLVQGAESILDTNSKGYIERDQQGTANSFNYNYWTSSVGPITSLASGIASGTKAINNDFTISGVLLDGSKVDGISVGVYTYPSPINFVGGAYSADTYDYTTGQKIISTRWLYKFNGTNNDYDSWQRISQNTGLLPGEGYTMKGTSGNVAIATDQNYVFRGKPYNGDFTLPIAIGDNRLIGNPYPSAMDADEFIKDNIKETINSKAGRNSDNIFNGALYFWDHFGQEDSHILKEYVGGYATYTLVGGAKAYANSELINNTGEKGNKRPGRYIPVNQGFFVIAAADTLTNSITPIANIDGGDIVFKNSQRIFITEGVTSVFMKSEKGKKATVEKTTETNDVRPKIRLLFDSPKGYHRQLLIGADENTTNDFDLGYDGFLADVGSEDMYWLVQGGKFVIQGVPNFNKDQEFPLGLKVSEAGVIRINIDELENLDEGIDLYIKDNISGETHQLNDIAFEINLEPGEYLDRFSLVFQTTLEVLDVAEEIKNEVYISMNNTSSELQISKNEAIKINKIAVFNTAGQLVVNRTKQLEARNIYIPILNMATGVYIVQINTNQGTIAKKVIIE